MANDDDTAGRAVSPRLASADADDTNTDPALITADDVSYNGDEPISLTVTATLRRADGTVVATHEESTASYRSGSGAWPVPLRQFAILLLDSNAYGWAQRQEYERRFGPIDQVRAVSPQTPS